MQIRCPHCRQPIELVDDNPTGDIECSSCGSSFNLAQDPEATHISGDIEETKSYEPEPRTLGHYELLNCLGQGAFGSVWKARDTELDRPVAIKIPRAERMTAEDADRFLREARAAAQVRHPNIVSVHEVGREEGRIYIASDLVEGASLDEWIEAHPLSVREAVELCAKVAAALHHAHEAGIVHRDLKPQNILMDMQGEPHITDFGLAKRDAGEITMTVEGAIMGTPAYMSPEQARGEAHQADCRSDVYSLGVMLFRLLTGELPFRGRSQMLIVQILKDEPPAPRKLDAKIPRDIETICLKCLEKDPARRYQTSADLAADLDRWLTGHPITARRVGRAERTWRWCRREPKLACLTVAVVLSLLSGSLISTWFALDANEQARLEGLARQEADNDKEKAKQSATLAEERRLEAEDNLRLADQRLYVADMNLAEQNWESAAVYLVLDRLDRYRNRGGTIANLSQSNGRQNRAPPHSSNPMTECAKDDPRGFEWYYWDRLCRSDLHTLKGHTRTVTSVAFSADGTRIASASSDNTVKLWDATTGQETATLKGHTGSVNSVAFSPDGTRIASASSDNTVKLWDAAMGRETATLKGHSKYVRSVSFSPDGTRIASASYDNTVKLWDATTGQENATLKGHTAFVNSVAFSPDGTRIASASWDHTVKLWDAATGQEAATLRGHSGWVASVAFSPDGTRIASASHDPTVKLWDVATGQETATLKGHTDRVLSVAFSPDGTRIASASHDQTMKLWDVATGGETATLRGHSSYVASVSFSPDGTRIASASSDHTVKLWDATTGQETTTLKGHTAFVNGVAFSPDGTRIASASWDHTVKLWDAATGQETTTLNGHSGVVESVAFSPDGTRIASASWDHTVKLWDAATGQETATLKGHTSRVISVVFSPDGARIASASWDHTVKLWDAATGQETTTLNGHSRVVESVAFSPDGARIASASYDGTVKLWDARPWTPEVKTQFEARGYLTFKRDRFESLEELQAEIRTDRTINDAVRQQALEWAELFWKNRKRTEP